MITITIYMEDQDKPSGVRVSGHAGYAEQGSDIVCAAVSILVINTVNSIERFTDDEFRCDTDEGTGNIDFNILSSVSKESELLIRSLLLGLEGVKNAYGEKYLKIAEGSRI
jgi:uncharacterized protein YsxB (DUF464 family)